MNATKSGPISDRLGAFFDPLTQRDVLDYNAYQHDIVADTILHFARLIKEEKFRYLLPALEQMGLFLK